MAKRKWSELPTSGKVAIVAGAALQAAVTTLALRDLQARPSSLVRGSKRLWRLAFLIQPAGPISYLLLGRRK